MLTWNSYPFMFSTSSTTGKYIYYPTHVSMPSFYTDIPVHYTYKTSGEGTSSEKLNDEYFDKWTGFDIVKEYNGKTLPLTDVNLNMNFHKNEESIKAELLQKFLDAWIPYKREKGESIDNLLEELELVMEIFK